MIKIMIVVILASAVPYCNKCLNNGMACADTFNFKVVDKTSGMDLVFSSGPTYHRDSVFLTTKYPGYHGKMSYPNNERFTSTLLLVVDTFYLRTSSFDTDTLLMKYDFIKDKCCPNDRFGKVTGVTFNGTEAFKDDDAFIFRK